MQRVKLLYESNNVVVFVRAFFIGGRKKMRQVDDASSLLEWEEREERESEKKSTGSLNVQELMTNQTYIP